MSLHMESNGMYGVLLHNKEGCTDSEIKSLVSQFGKVRFYNRVPKSGADLIFIHFKEYEEARACLEQLERDPMFCAMPARPREGRVPKSFLQRVQAKSADRAAAEKKSILRSRSVLAAKASQIDSSSSSNEDKQANVVKDVRFVRPGESSPSHERRRRSRSRDVPLSPDSSQSGDRPPHLLNMMDVWTESYTEESGVLTSTEVIIYNVPLHITDGQVFALCDRFVPVLSVEVDDFQFNKIPFKLAVVQVRTPDDARLLKKCLHRRTLKGKVLKVVFSADFY